MPATNVENIVPDHVLTAETPHSKFSRLIPPTLTVKPGEVIEIHANDATGAQVGFGATYEEIYAIDFDKVHSLTGPIYVEGAEPGDTLVVELIDFVPGNWGWTVVDKKGGGFLPDDEFEDLIKTYRIDRDSGEVEFSDGIRIPFAPFAGILAVAPDTDEMLVTFPPRANGGNMDDRHMTAGTTVFLPVFVEGALFSAGDTHIVQGKGEVAGTAVEAPMTMTVRLSLIKKGTPGWRPLPEPQYEKDDYYATTGFGETLDEAAKKATRYMIDYIEDTRGLSRAEAYMLCSLACDLEIAEVVDHPHMLVAMHLRKDIFKD